MAIDLDKYEKFDIADYLNTKEDIATYLTIVLEDSSADEFVSALGDVARSKGMTEISRVTGLGRESLYKALKTGKKPQFDTVLKVTRALGIKFQVVA